VFTVRRLIPILLVAMVLPAGASDQQALLRLARAAIEAEVQGGSLPHIEGGSTPRAVFVTIEQQGRVRGCRGALTTRTRSLEDEIVWTARAAAAHDSRYRPLTREALASIQVTLTIVQQLERLDTIGSLRPSDGLVLGSGGRTGVVLPWEGSDPQLRLQWACKKAGVAPTAPFTLYRMIAERFRG
jgi:AMMECR1 domain-containing protein